MFHVLFAVVFMLGFAGSQIVSPSGIPRSTRDQWCLSQTAACPLICQSIHGGSDAPASNTCDPKTLDYSCVCSNGQAPNSSEYSQTIPYFVCTQQNTDCVNNCNGAQSCQFACRAQHPCGAQSPKRVKITTHATATATSTPSPTNVVYNGFGSAGTEQAKQGASPIAMSIDVGRVYGLLIVMGGILAGFGLLL